jgi:hypothetical protein
MTFLTTQNIQDGMRGKLLNNGLERERKDMAVAAFK